MFIILVSSKLIKSSSKFNISLSSKLVSSLHIFLKISHGKYKTPQIIRRKWKKKTKTQNLLGEKKYHKPKVKSKYMSSTAMSKFFEVIG